MAKHAHRLMLNQKKTWRCTLPNCRYFIHIGLAHILPGQQSVCWECGEEFMLDEEALKEEMPKCAGCRGGIGAVDMTDYINTRLALSKAGVKSLDELTPERKQVLKMIGALPEKDVELFDQVEVDDGEEESE